MVCGVNGARRARTWAAAHGTTGGTSRFPILAPTLLGTAILLFGNAFGAYATAYAFTGSFLNLVTIVIGAQIQGDVLYNPGLGNAMALGMIIIMSLVMMVYMLVAEAGGEVAPMKRFPIWSWFWFLIGMLYFFLPLISTLEFSLRMIKGKYTFEAYRVAFQDPRFYTVLWLLAALGDADDHHQPAAGGPDGLLGSAQAAQGSTLRRVRHADAVRRASRRADLRPDPPVRAAAPGAHDDARGADRRLHSAVASVHVPFRRLRPARGRHPHADRGGTEPGRRLGDDPQGRHLPQPARSAAERHLPDLRHCDGRVHLRRLDVLACVWPVHRGNRLHAGLHPPGGLA